MHHSMSRHGGRRPTGGTVAFSNAKASEAATVVAVELLVHNRLKIGKKLLIVKVLGICFD